MKEPRQPLARPVRPDTSLSGTSFGQRVMKMLPEYATCTPHLSYQPNVFAMGAEQLIRFVQKKYYSL